jgi:hypothetical protein
MKSGKASACAGSPGGLPSLPIGALTEPTGGLRPVLGPSEDSEPVGHEPGRDRAGPAAVSCKQLGQNLHDGRWREVATAVPPVRI